MRANWSVAVRWLSAILFVCVGTACEAPNPAYRGPISPDKNRASDAAELQSDFVIGPSFGFDARQGMLLAIRQGPERRPVGAKQDRHSVVEAPTLLALLGSLRRASAGIDGLIRDLVEWNAIAATTASAQSLTDRVHRDGR